MAKWESSMIDSPDSAALEALPNVTVDELPQFAPAIRTRDPPVITDVSKQAKNALGDLDIPDRLSSGDEIAITAGSRGIESLPAILETIITELTSQGYEPFIVSAMGSHGGATAEGQRDLLESMGITESTMGCEIRSSMRVETVGETDTGRPVVLSRDALAADGILLVNRVKAHTNFNGAIESGLCKMAVVGLGKQAGAKATHDAAMDSDFEGVLRERMSVLLSETPIIGGVAIVENAHEHAAQIEGIQARKILDNEPELMNRARQLQPMLPVDNIDLLIIDEIGKNISGPGMDTNIVGRLRIQGTPDPDTPAVTRIYARDLSEKTGGNANGMGLADFGHERIAEKVDLQETYVNCLTAGVPERGQLPIMTPTDRTALIMTYGTVPVSDPSELRIIHIRNTLEVDDLHVSAPIASELESRREFDVGTLTSLNFHNGNMDSI